MQTSIFGQPRPLSATDTERKTAGLEARQLDYVRWGEYFKQPTLDRDCQWLIVGELVYEYNGDGELVVVDAGYVFDIPADTKYIGRQLGGLVRKVPCSSKNLIRFSQLPLISDEDRVEALNMWYHWEVLVPWVAATSLMLKNGAVPVEGHEPYRLPATSRTIKVPRKPTYPEQIALSMGMMKLDDLLEEKVVHDVYQEAVDLKQYCRGKYEPYSQQLIAAWCILQAKRWPLWLDMRTGKTLAAMMAARALIEQGKIDHVLVVCPVTNMYDPWLPELIAQGFEVRVLDGTSEEDEESIDSVHSKYGFKPDAFVVNYERLGSRMELMDESWDWSRVMLIADETSAIKEPRASRSRSMHEVSRKVEYLTLLNGTPMEQGPHDMWSQMHCVDPWGVKWGRTFGAFSYEWLEPTGYGKYVVPKDRKMFFEMHLSMHSLRYIRAEADQFAGKDKQFRYVALKPTKQMLLQAEQIKLGFLNMVDEAGVKQSEEMTRCVLRTYGFMRENACSYAKYRQSGDSKYTRVRHELDPKLLWTRCFIESYPGTPLVIFVEFTEEEQRLKEMLDEMKVKWSSTRPHMERVPDKCLKAKITRELWDKIKVQFPDKETLESVFVFPGDPAVELPEDVMHDAEIVSWVLEQRTADINQPHMVNLRNKVEAARRKADPRWNDNENDREVAQAAADRLLYKYNRLLESLGGYAQYADQCATFIRYLDRGPYPPSERADQIADFNEGRSHVFILKWSQGRGMSLSRKEAVAAGIGTWPTIISLAPTWSLGSWDQGLDRCVVTDPATGKNVCTMVYALGIKGSIEDYILEALRKKKNVQQTLLQDAQRQGYSSFIEGLIDGMKDAMNETGDNEYFDSEEMYARIVLKIPPFSKVTESRILSALKDLWGLRTQKEAAERINTEVGEVRDAYDLLMRLV